jgi:hypothetical protein
MAATLAGAAWPRSGRSAETEGSKEVPWLAEVQRCPTLEEEAVQLAPLLVDAQGNKIDSLKAWKKRREEIRRIWLDFLGPLQLRHTPPKLELLKEDRPKGCIRQLVRYETEPGVLVEAYLLKPALRRSDCPGVVAMHSTVKFTIRQPAGLEGDEEDFFGLKLAQRGVVAFCPRCFLWQGPGTYQQQVARFEQRHPGSTGMAKMLWDAQRGLDVLESLPEVDANRLGAVGHSLGAKEALYLAAFDPRVKVTVSSEGGIGTKFSNWDAPWYLGQAVKEGKFTREHHELLALVAPRPFLLLGGDSADGRRSWPFIQAVLPAYGLYGGTPRVGLFNHQKGHSVPPEAQRRLYQWFDTYL